ncbi:MAG: right-handed parallel beta-helix repeat-containing protein [Clostridia bacterium]|nr:right-handed parallel beta-helix repeat-containing protein [Clostridia bacterium]
MSNLYKKIIALAGVIAMLLTAVGCVERAPSTNPETQGETLPGVSSFLVPEGEKTVLELGLTGDGVTDDAPALKALISSMSKNGGGTLYFPKGTYRLCSNVSINKNFRCVFEEGAVLTPDEKYKITLSGYVEAGAYPIVSSATQISGALQNLQAYPQWYGAKGDGVADDSEAFKRAMLSASEVLVPATEAGYCVNTLSLIKPFSLTGVSVGETKPRIYAMEDTKYLLEFKASQISVSNLIFDMSRCTNKNSVAFYFDTTVSTRIRDFYFKNVDVNGAYCAVKDAKHAGGNQVVCAYFDYMNFTNGRGTAFDVEDFWGFIQMDHCTLDFSNDVNMDYPAIKVKDNAGLTMNYVKVIGPGTGSSANGHAFDFSNDIAVWINNCSAINMDGAGIKSRGSNTYFYIWDFLADNCNDFGLDILNSTSFKMHGITVKGRVGQADFYQDRDGIRVSNSSLCQLTDINVSNCPGNGLSVRSATNVAISGLKASDNTDYGYLELGSNGATLADAEFSGNGEGNFSQGTASAIVLNAKLANGTVLEATEGHAVK